MYVALLWRFAADTVNKQAYEACIAKFMPIRCPVTQSGHAVVHRVVGKPQVS